MTQFKVGDKVECLWNHYGQNIVPGKVYTVKHVTESNGNLTLEEFSLPHNYQPDKFKLCNPLADLEEKVNKIIDGAVAHAIKNVEDSMEMTLDTMRTQLLDSLRTELNGALNLNLGA